MPDIDRATRAAIEVEGTELGPEIEAEIERVVIDDSLNVADMFEVAIRDSDRQALTRTGLRIGAVVKVRVTPLGSRTPVLLMSGEVTSLEAAYDVSGSRVIVRGYDLAHRLARGRQAETYRNAKYSDIVSTIAGRVGIPTGTIDDSGEVKEFVYQANQTDLEFLRGLAREIGFLAVVADGKLDFRRPARASDAPASGEYGSTNPLQLVFGEDLLEFRPRVTGAGQVAKVEVRGWNVDQKAALVGIATAETSSASLPDNPGALAALFGSPTHIVSERAFGTQREVGDAATATADAIASAFAEATGVARGNPAIKAGAAISISHVAEPFVGRYTLTHTRHVFDDRDGYRTHFVVSGRQDRSLLGLASGGGTAAAGPMIGGVVVGIVSDTSDEEKLGRVKLKFPWLADHFDTNWARVSMPGAGPKRGIVWLPEVNDEVLVAFEHGDIRRPYVLAGLWNGVDAVPDLPVHGSERKARGFVSRSGSKIVMHDESGKVAIDLVTAGGQYEIHLDEGNSQISIKASGGKVVIEAQQDIKISATGKVTVEATQGLELKSSGIVKVQGAQVQLG